MPLLFPLTRDVFLNTLPIASATFEPGGKSQATGLEGGEILTSQRHAPRWSGTYKLATMPARSAAKAEALLQALEQDAGATFHACRANRIGPAEDKLGAGLAGAMPVIAALGATAATVSLGGLPEGYVLRRGDLFSFEYGGTVALHRLAQGATVQADGATYQVAIYPHLRPGAVVGAAVEWLRPYCKAVVVPGSVDYGADALGKVSGMSFAWRQTLA